MSILLISLSFSQHVTEFLQRASNQLRLLPQVRCQESVSIANGDECSLECVFERLGRSGGRSISVFDAGKLEKTLDGWGGDEAGTSGCRDELGSRSISIPILFKSKSLLVRAYSDGNATTLPTLLCWQAVWCTQVRTPVSATDGNDAKLGDDDGSADGGCDFLRGLDTKADVSL